MWTEAHMPGAAAVACPAPQNPTTSIPLLCSLLSIMASECESGDAMTQHGQHEHLRPDGTEPLSRIAVDYTPDACHHARATGEIHVTYDHRGGARWRSPCRFLPGGAVAAAVRAPAGDTAGLNYNLYLSSLEGSPDMDEIDFEFLGGDKRAVQTNFYVGGCGGREMVHELPFDSSDGFHHYAVAWGADAIEWRVDGELVRREERGNDGEPWPEKPMFLYASLWDASGIDEGRWTGTYHGRDAPYVCSYRDVRVPFALSVTEEEEECQDDANAAGTICSAAAVAEVDAGAGED
ncbi:xyloglucan endotransglucosylase/hydrolase protein 31-like [Lolium rigidum]|uniref:xyloglucan endotransglucosylase/hydrolase protein 31-like n=1 Tax=Lolium rigidum TaxID=89674 RepID=UPI001F5DBF24|nr:xyloglucan endotransglucosylase/hydrolase protein 31-like [Lolium rigidum]